MDATPLKAGGHRPKGNSVKPASAGRGGGIRVFIGQHPGFIVAGVLAVLATLLYLNSFRVPWQFDDRPNIVDNPTVHVHTLSLERIGKLFTASYSGSIRFFSYFTFAVNFYFGKLDVFGYHLVNLLIHLATGIAVFYFIFLTFEISLRKQECGTMGFRVAFVTSLLFVAHPIQTQSITYIVQRMSSMAALFYLLSLIFYIKGRFSSGKARVIYYGAMGLSGLLSMFSKENAFVLPLFILLYEVLVIGPREGVFSLRKITPFLLILAGLGIAGLLLGGPKYLDVIREGYRYRDFTLSERVLTQFRVVLFYVTLLVFPHPSRLNVDHDFTVSKSLFVPPDTFLSLLAIVLVIGVAIWKMRRWPLVSFFIFWYFGNLAIESSIFPLEMVYEHRLYLPSVGPIFLFSLLLVTGWEKWAPGEGYGKEGALALLIVALVLPLSWWTVERNEIWGSEFTLWKDSAGKSPDKARPHYNLGYYYHAGGQTDQAVKEFEWALRLDPRMAPAHFNLGMIAYRRGALDEAADRLKKALSANPGHTQASLYLAEIYGKQGRAEESRSILDRTFQRSPQDAGVFNDRGMIFMKEGDLEKAEKDFRRAIALDANRVEPRVNLSEVLLRKGSVDQALEEIRGALKTDPRNGDAHTLFGMIQLQKGKTDEAIAAFRKALEIDPKEVTALTNLGIALRQRGRIDEAIVQFRKVLSMMPDDEESHVHLGESYLSKGMLDEAVGEGRHLVRINSRSVVGRLVLGEAYFKKGNLDEAILEWKKALEVNPREAKAHHNLAAAYYLKKEYGSAVKHLDQTLALGFKVNPQLSESLRPYRSQIPK